jgi:diaminopimelate epimerase
MTLIFSKFHAAGNDFSFVLSFDQQKKEQSVPISNITSKILQYKVK